MRWLCALIAAMLSAFVFMPIHFGKWFRRGRFITLAAKAVPTLMAAGFALYALLHQPGDLYALLIFCGILVGAAADVWLGIHFVTGGFLFLLGHLLYSTAFVLLQPPTGYSLPVFALAFAGLLLFCQRYRPHMKNAIVRNGLPFYCAALSAIIAISFPTVFLLPAQRSLLAASGAIVFAISDMGVFHGIVVRTTRRFSFCFLGIYYLAQLMLGMSAFAA